jgi:threonine dehydrogenase-like Zn-dependent dehydrogenase
VSQHVVKALRIHGPGDLRIDELAASLPAVDETVIRIEYGGICGSDLHYWREGAVGASVLKAPMTLGHEVVGTVVRAASDSSGPAEGDLVVPHPAQTCGVCEWCRNGQRHLCAACRYLGSAARWPHTDGGFATELTMPVARLIPVPPGMTAQRAVLAEPASIAWHAVSRVEQVGSRLVGADVLVVGAGPIGLLVAAIAQHRGAGSVSVVDVHDHPLRVAREVGLHDVFQVGEQLPTVDIAFESSGTAAGLACALHAVGRGSTVVTVGQLPAVDASVPAWLVVTNELTMTGSLRLDTEIPAALGFLAAPDLNIDAIVTHVHQFADATQAFAVAGDVNMSSKVLLRFADDGGAEASCGKGVGHRVQRPVPEAHRDDPVDHGPLFGPVVGLEVVGPVPGQELNGVDRKGMVDRDEQPTAGRQHAPQLAEHRPPVVQQCGTRDARTSSNAPSGHGSELAKSTTADPRRRRGAVGRRCPRRAPA